MENEQTKRRIVAIRLLSDLMKEIALFGDGGTRRFDLLPYEGDTRSVTLLEAAQAVIDAPLAYRDVVPLIGFCTLEQSEYRDGSSGELLAERIAGASITRLVI